MADKIRKVYDLFATRVGGQIDMTQLMDVSKYSKQVAKFLGALDVNGAACNSLSAAQSFPPYMLAS